MSRMNWDRVRWESKLREPDDEWERMNFLRQRAEQQACPLPPPGHQRLTSKQAKALQALAIELGFGSIPRLPEKLLGQSHDLQTLSIQKASILIERAKTLRDGVQSKPYTSPSTKPVETAERWIPARQGPKPKQESKRDAAPAPRAHRISSSAGSLQALSDRALSLNLSAPIFIPSTPAELKRLIDALISKGQGRVIDREQESLIERCIGNYSNRAPYLVWSHLLTPFLRGDTSRPPCRREKAREEVTKVRLKFCSTTSRPDAVTAKQMLRCKVCGCLVRSDRMQSHSRRVHSR